MSRADPQQQGFLGTKMEQKWPMSCGLALRVALKTARFGARFRACNREFQVCDLRFCGAPKGIRILVVLVTIGDYRDSLVRRSCGESQWVPTSTNSHHVFGHQIGHQIVAVITGGHSGVAGARADPRSRRRAATLGPRDTERRARVRAVQSARHPGCPE